MTLRDQNSPTGRARYRHTHQRRQVAVGMRQDQRFDGARLAEQGVADPRR